MLLTNFKTKSLHTNRFILSVFLVGLPVYCFSYFFLSNYDLSDAFHYTSYWNVARYIDSFQDLFKEQSAYIGSNDAGYSLIIGLTALLPIGRYEFFSLLNSIAAVFVSCAYLRKWLHLPLYYSCIFLSFYIPVLLLVPERLRLSIFLLLFSFLTNSFVIRIFLLILSVLTHSQSILLIGSLYFYLYYQDLKLSFLKVFKFKINKRYSMLIVFSLLALLYLQSNPVIANKLSSYFQQTFSLKFYAVGSILILTYLFGFISQALFFASLFLLTANSLFLGSYLDRTVIFFYFIYLVDYWALHVRKSRSVILFLLLLCVTTWKSILFYSDVISGGGGFSN